MSKKWLLTLSGSLLAAIIVTGCADDQDPAPPEDTIEENPAEENLDEEGQDGGMMDDQGTEEGTPEDGTNEGTEEGAGTDGTEGAENGTTEHKNKDK
jgi:hypothetical protein